MIDHDEIAADLLRNIGVYRQAIARLDDEIASKEEPLKDLRVRKKSLETNEAGIRNELKERMIENGLTNANVWSWTAHVRTNAPITTIVDQREAYHALQELGRLNECLTIDWGKATAIFAAMPEPPPGTERVASTSLVVREVKHE